MVETVVVFTGFVEIVVVISGAVKKVVVGSGVVKILASVGVIVIGGTVIV